MLLAVVRADNLVVQRVIAADAIGDRKPPMGYLLVAADETVHRGYIYNTSTQTFGYGGMADDWDVLLLGGPAGATNYRAGSVGFALAALTQDIVFSSPLPNINYGVFMFPNITVNIPGANKTINGFRAVATLSVATTVSWIAIPYQ